METNNTVIPYVIVGKAGEQRTFDIYSRLLEERIVFLNGQVDDHSSASIVAQLLHLSASGKNQPIDFYINSPGGSVTAGLAIVDTMNLIPNKVKTYCVGQACSMGAVILSNGTKGQRHCLENARVMIHQPSGGVQGTAADIQTSFEEMTRLKDVLYRILSQRCGKTVEEMTEDCSKDYFMSAEDALGYGIIDRVIKEEDTEDGVQGSWS